MTFFRKLASFLIFASLVAVAILVFDLFVVPTSLFGTLFTSKSSVLSAATTAGPAEEPHALALSRQALRNIGITDEAIREVAVSVYEKTISFPAMLVDRPGRSTVRVPAPFTGIVQKVYVEPGMVVEPGQPLFDILLTHEELIQCQNDLIALCQKRDTVERETERLDLLSTDVAPRTKRETAIQKAEIDAQIDTQRSILRLHGISDREIRETIEGKRSLVQKIVVRVPALAEDREIATEAGETKPAADQEDRPHAVVQMESLFVDKGQLVSLGDPLCQLVDLSLLYIEGRASSNDENLLATALMEHCNVTALFDGERVEGLRIRYIDTRIDSVSRALRFYVELPNSVVVRNADQSHHHPWSGSAGLDSCPIHKHYVNWRFRPGQRCELKIEYDTIPDCIVLPRESVADSGSDAFVFEWTGTEPEGERRKVWQKRPVHVLHRSKSLVAIANDGSIFPGAKVVTRGAGQLLVALTSGGGQLQSTCPCGDH